MIGFDSWWTERVDEFDALHRDPVNRRCHLLGIPMIAASIPLGATLVGLPVAVPLFATGWALNFAGHWYEGSQPAMVERVRRDDVPFDPRHHLVGAAWWLAEVGLATRDRGHRRVDTAPSRER